jgi:Xaa-Pro aminopeptidase
MNSDRLAQVAAALENGGSDLLLVTPGADLRYLTGYQVLPLERLTCLAINRSGQAWLIVPLLERPAAQAAGVADLGIEILSWHETQDPYALLANAVGSVISPVVNNSMWVEKAHYLEAAFGSEVGLANNILSDIRMVKSQAEIAALHEAGAAIDQVHSQMGKWLRPGRTEREVGRDIAEAIIAAGHDTVDFVIVASGPNGASPHHEVSDRVIQAGEPVVVDIGGTMPNGYCSDSTRMYACGEVEQEFADMYEVLKRAQGEAVTYARAGVSCESVDAISRDILAEHNLAEFFIHRTGHGIGMETHEEPYIVSGNTRLVQEGHAFSIEPGFYIPGRFGARIEDIVTCWDGHVSSANNTTHDLVIF